MWIPRFARNLALFGGSVLAASPVLATQVTEAWARPGYDDVAVYLTVNNDRDTPTTIVGARTALAERVEIHRSMAVSHNGTMGMSMAPVSKVAVPPHGHFDFSPGGYHFMLIHPHKPLTLGMRFPLILLYANGSRQIVPVSVTSGGDAATPRPAPMHGTMPGR